MFLQLDFWWQEHDYVFVKTHRTEHQKQYILLYVIYFKDLEISNLKTIDICWQ